MTSALDDRARLVITGILGRNSVMLPFAEAVVRHLSRFREDPRESGAIAEKVALILSTVRDPEQPPPIELLREWPELLASFFQNADLLPAGAPESAGVARLVISAVESLDAGAG